MTSTLFHYPITIKETYLDTFGHVNNATYLTLFEEARWEFITKRGFGMAYIQKSGLGPTVLEITINFLRELKLRDEVVIETQMLSYEKKIGRLSQKMLRQGEVCCSAEFVIGLFDLGLRKLILPTPEWLMAIGLTD